MHLSSLGAEQHLIKDVDEGLVTSWMQVSAAFGQGADRSEAQSFILRCVEALHRERQVCLPSQMTSACTTSRGGGSYAYM